MVDGEIVANLVAVYWFKSGFAGFQSGDIRNGFREVLPLTGQIGCRALEIIPQRQACVRESLKVWLAMGMNCQSRLVACKVILNTA